MKTKLLLSCTAVLLAMFAAACGVPSTADLSTEEPATSVPETAEPQAVTIDDLNSLMEALRSAGATIEASEDVEQPFFTAIGKILKVNGADVQVFVYDTAGAMEADAAQVAEDGSSIGTSMVTWMGPPHFYKLERMIVLYVGDDTTVQTLLEGVLGPQFAGQ